MIKVNITELMVDVEPQTVITRDKLNAIVDAVVYYKIMDVKKSVYNVDDHRAQLTSLARTTLRAVIGKMTLTEANENRDDINMKVEKVLDKETDSYGVEVLRVEIQKIEPPEDDAVERGLRLAPANGLDPRPPQPDTDEDADRHSKKDKVVKP